MQRVKASALELVDPPAFDEPPEPLPPHAANSRTSEAVAMMAIAVRAVGDHARRARRMTRVLSFIVLRF
jgi:hypothetical protein